MHQAVRPAGRDLRDREGSPAGASAPIDAGEYHYDLPKDRIALRPVSPRDDARLLVLDRETGALEHRVFRDLPALLRPGDLVVLNDARVRPARLLGRKAGSGGGVEIFLLRRRETPPAPAPGGRDDRLVGAVRPRIPAGADVSAWEALVRPGRRLANGVEIEFPGAPLRGTIHSRMAEGRRLVLLSTPAGEGTVDAWIERIGHMPLPPYIDRPDDAEDREDYQTVFARVEGAVAAPTAGLHFTEELLHRLRSRGIGVASLTLHVGEGTFRPLTAGALETGRLEGEDYAIPGALPPALRETRLRGGRVVAVGTTVTRALESATRKDGALAPGPGSTDLFLRPPCRFRAVDALVTNFHLPGTSLLMLVAAFAGRERVLGAYREAIARGYRFYSYGDAMLVLDRGPGLA